jgi:predicted LPLAT superfamily acyltransferase
MKPQDRTWVSVQERGSLWAIRIMALLVRTLGLGPARLLLHPTVAYFLLTDGQARRASRRYLERLHAMPGGAEALGRPPGLQAVYRHLHAFASTALDQVMAWFGSFERFQIDLEGFEPMHRHVDNGRGCLLLGAHLGNVGMLRVMAESKSRPLSVVMFRGNTQMFNKVLKEMAPESDVRVLEYEPGSPGSVLEIKQRIDAGELVAMLADRMPPGARRDQRVVEVPFLGHAAPLPSGPWIIASVIGCPVFWVCGLRTGPRRYRLMARPLGEGLPLPRGERKALLKELVTRYTAILEEVCLEQPYQWFNFYDFWQED